MLHEDLLQSLMELPEQYDFGAYSHFITEYGTHYITEGVMGGILDYTVVVDKKEMEKQSKDRRFHLMSIVDINSAFDKHIHPNAYTIQHKVPPSLT